MTIFESDYSFFHHIDDIFIVGSNDNRFSLFIERIEQMDNFISIGFIKISRGLISDNDARMMNERASDTGTLNFSTRECFYEFFLLCKKSYLREYLRNTLVDLLLRISTDLHCKGNILSHCLSWEEFKILKYDPKISTITEEFVW